MKKAKSAEALKLRQDIEQEQIAVERVLEIALKPPPDPVLKELWIARLVAALRWIARNALESVDLVREIGPGVQPLDRHVWEPKPFDSRPLIR